MKKLFKTCIISFLLFPLSLLGQVVDEPAEKDKTIPKGFFTVGLGFQSSMGYTYGSISYNHLIGHFGGDSYLGIEIGSLISDDGTYAYRYMPIMLCYTGYIGSQSPQRRFIGYANLKVGTAKFREAKLISRSTIFTLPPSEESLFAFGLNGGGQLRVSSHLYLFGEAGLGTMYTVLFGLTVKL